MINSRLEDTLIDAIESAITMDYSYIGLYHSCGGIVISVIYYKHFNDIINSKTLEILNDASYKLVLVWQRSIRQVVYLDLQQITKKIVTQYKKEYPYPIDCYAKKLQYAL